MGLANILKEKNEAMGKKSSASILKVNKYESPKSALDLIAHICTSSDSIDINDCFDGYREKTKLLNQKINSNEFDLNDREFIDEIYYVANYLESALTNSSTDTIKIAVAGGFSSGKSSFLNAITKIGNVLPTGIEPVSVVNTFLNCKKDTPKVSVKGINLKDQLVLLNEEVLSCIQHSSKSKVYIASILKNILLDIPCKEYLDGITFIDTPGYNNSNAANLENSVTDKDTALESFNKANALIWCIDIEAGTITTKDIEMLKTFGNKGPIVIVFTKMDKKPTAETNKIIDSAFKLCKQKLGSDAQLLDIIAVSCINDKISINASSKNFSVEQLFKEIRSKAIQVNDFQEAKTFIKNLFDGEIDASKNLLNQLEKNRKSLITEKKEKHKAYLEAKETWTDFTNETKELLLTNYDSLLNSVEYYQKCFNDLLDLTVNSINRETEWDDKSGMFSDTSNLNRKRDKDIDKLNKIQDAYSTIEFQYYEEDYREKVFDVIKGDQDRFIDYMKGDYEDSEQNYTSTIESIEKEEKFMNLIKQYYTILNDELINGYKEGLNRLKKQRESLHGIETAQQENIFDAISSDNMTRFLSCFSRGVDLSVCNKEGYSPLTWAVKSGNNEMVKFFINHEEVVDISAPDKRGYNALETAVMCHFQDICTLLLDKDKSLVASCRPLSELAKQNNFVNWISQF